MISFSRCIVWPLRHFSARRIMCLPYYCSFSCFHVLLLPKNLIRNFSSNPNDFSDKEERIKLLYALPGYVLRQKADELVNSGDRNLGAEYLAVAADKGDVESMYELGYLFSEACKLPGSPEREDIEAPLEQDKYDPKKLIQLIKKSANEAFRKQLKKKTGIDKQISNDKWNPYDDSIKYLTKAAEAGHKQGMVLLANILLQSPSQSQDTIKSAMTWYKIAASDIVYPGRSREVIHSYQSRCESALFNLSRLYMVDDNDESDVLPVPSRRHVVSNPSLSYYFMNLAAKFGDEEAKMVVAEMNGIGLACTWNPATGNEEEEKYGLPTENSVFVMQPPSSEYILHLLHDCNLPRAFRVLHSLYRDGNQELGLQQNDELSMNYLMKGAIVKDDVCCLILGSLLIHATNDKALEIGFPREKGIEMLAYSAGNGNTEAMVELGLAYLWSIEGLIETDHELAFLYFQEAADKNNMMGWFNVAYMHFYGVGVPKSTQTAKHIIQTLKKSMLYDWEVKKQLTPDLISHFVQIMDEIEAHEL